MRALITGVTGQDGSYLAEFLLEKGYEVIGMVRRSSTENFERIEHIRDRIDLKMADLLDQLSLINLIREVKPDEVKATYKHGVLEVAMPKAEVKEAHKVKVEVKG